ncbi:MAG: PEP-CTERM sorting domain-containing protein [Bryobacterales bacterium]|nr:PEP-CTERM sorting domain-containing protein [Bryobacterales bacterium]
MTVFPLPLVAVCGLVLAMGAAAAPLSPVAVSGSVFFNLEPPPRVDFLTFGVFPLAGPGGSLQFSATSGPSPQLLAEVNTNTGYYGRSVGTLSYYLQIVGPAGDVPVSLSMQGKALGNSITGSRFASFAVGMLWWLHNETTATPLIAREGIESGAIAGPYDQDFDPLYLLLLRAGDIYKVTLQVGAEAAAGSGASANASARLRPLFQLDAGPEYSLLFSDGIGNAATPEPAALGLMSLGLGLAYLRRNSNSRVGASSGRK